MLLFEKLSITNSYYEFLASDGLACEISGYCVPVVVGFFLLFTLGICRSLPIKGESFE